MIFYYHYVGDYDRDTKGLSLIEHGAYRLLLDHMYATEDRIPDDKGEVYRIAKAMTPAERRAVDRVLDKFFPVNGDGLRHNKRAEREIEKAHELMEGGDERRKNERERQRRHRERRQHLFEQLRSFGVTAEYNSTTQDLERALQRYTNGKRDVSVTSDVTEDVTRDATATRTRTKNQEETNTSTADAVEARGKAAGIPDCPHEKLLSLYHELLPQCTRVEKWTAARQQTMRARWRDEALPNREKHRGYRTIEEGLAYWQRFFGWVSESKFLTGQAHGRDGKPPFVASLPWLMKAENFAKVIEGTYHRDL